MSHFFWKSCLPYLLAVVLFLGLSLTYFNPVLEGKVILGADTKSYLAASKEAVDCEKITGEQALWTNGMFGGMPTYQITGEQPNNLLKYIDKTLSLVPRPVFFGFMYLAGGFLLLLMLGLNPYLSMAGAAALAFTSYNFIIIAAGHNTKAVVIAYMMPLIGSILLSFKGKKWLGGILTALFLALAVKANHLQILYYTLFVVILLFISELIFSIREKRASELAKTTGVLALAAVLALAVNAGSLLTTYEYSQYTMRGESTGLTDQTDNAAHGLGTEYITKWSYGISETGTLFIPDFRGGASSGTLSADSHTARKLQELGASVTDEAMQEFQLPLYWGDQPGTSGPVYLGAIVCFLFVLGLFLAENRYKWWLLAATVLSVLLAWGKNYLPLTEFFIQYVPLYNKFRAVSMTLVIAGVCVPLLGLLGLKAFLEEESSKKKLLSAIGWSAGITGGLCLLFALAPSLAGNFVAPTDAQTFTGDYAFLKDTLPLDRKDLLSADAWRSLVFILLAAGTLYLFIFKKLKAEWIVAVLGVLILIDLWGVDKRYINDRNFVDREVLFDPIRPTKADNEILKDQSLDYRVLDLTKDIFNDASPAYFHKSIGGYHAAKLRRYQDLIQAQLQPEIESIYMVLQTAQTLEDITVSFQHLGVLNMLNMKYLIVHHGMPPIQNPYANGNAWFVDKFVAANSANEEMKLLGEIDTKTEAVYDKSRIKIGLSIAQRDTVAQIALTNYSPNKLTYEYNSATLQFVVFSEIYYEKGWNAYLDGKETPYFRVDYLLRAMTLPAGKHTVEFRFEPASYRIGNAVSLIASLLLFIGLAAVVGFTLYKKTTKKDE